MGPAPRATEHVRRRVAALVVVAVVGAALLFALRPVDGRSSLDQGWPPFVLVAGLLLIGFVAEQEGVFRCLGARVGAVAHSDRTLFFGAAGVIGIVTATLNLDTSVVFCTPVFLHAARERGGDERRVLYGSIVLANAGSLFLPGSNLTNLIVLDRVGSTSARFVEHLWAPALAAYAASVLVIVLACRRGRPSGIGRSGPVLALGGPIGIVAMVAATIAVLLLADPAIPVFVVGLAAVAAYRVRRPVDTAALMALVDPFVLCGLLSVVVAGGVVGRWWGGPSEALAHLDTWGTVGLAAVSAVVINNLPASSLLASHLPARPYALLVGLNIGPNLLPTGSLAWLLWWKAARGAGARPSLRTAVAVGAASGCVALVAATAVLALVG